MLRKEYLNQTFNFMPELKTLYDKTIEGSNYEEAQRQITEKEDYAQLGIKSFNFSFKQDPHQLYIYIYIYIYIYTCKTTF